jgi:hypothetical protein
MLEGISGKRTRIIRKTVWMASTQAEVQQLDAQTSTVVVADPSPQLQTQHPPQPQARGGVGQGYPSQPAKPYAPAGFVPQHPFAQGYPCGAHCWTDVYTQ